MEEAISKCSKCDKEIIFVKTRGGKQMPCDPAMITILTDAGDIERGRISHFATCPFASDFRKGKK